MKEIGAIFVVPISEIRTVQLAAIKRRYIGYISTCARISSYQLNVAPIPLTSLPPFPPFPLTVILLFNLCIFYHLVLDLSPCSICPCS